MSKKEIWSINKAWLILIIVPILLLTSCDQRKINDQEVIIEQLIVENEQLKNENLILIAEIEKYKESDEYYYQSGADAFLNKNYYQAIEFMNRVKVKFPTSNMLEFAEKIILDANAEIKKQIDRRFGPTSEVGGGILVPVPNQDDADIFDRFDTVIRDSVYRGTRGVTEGLRMPPGDSEWEL